LESLSGVSAREPSSSHINNGKPPKNNAASNTNPVNERSTHWLSTTSERESIYSDKNINNNKTLEP
jgi:hypothetical protein